MKEESSCAHSEDRDTGDTSDREKPCSSSRLEISELGCCEYCGGPVKKRRLCSPLKRFCSKACARSLKRPKVRNSKGRKIKFPFIIYYNNKDVFVCVCICLWC